MSKKPKISEKTQVTVASILNEFKNCKTIEEMWKTISIFSEQYELCIDTCDNCFCSSKQYYEKHFEVKWISYD